MEKEKKQVVILFMYLLFVIVLEMTAIAPLSPVIAEIYNIKVSDVSLLNIGFAFAGLFAPFFGYVADKYGVKNTILTGMLLFATGSLLLSLTNSAFFYVIARFIIGLGYYSVFGLIYSYSSLIIDEKIIGKVSGIYKIVFALAVISSPAIGAYLINIYSINAIYMLLLFLAIIAILFISKIKFPDKKVEKIALKDIKMLLKDKLTYEFILITFLIAIPQMTFFIYYSVHLGLIGLGQGMIAKMYMITSFGSLIAGILIMSISDKVGKLKLMILGFILSAIAVLITASKNVNVLIAVSFFFGLGFDILWGLHFTMASLKSKKATGTFIAILSLSMALTHIISNLLSPIIYRLGGFRGNTVVCFIGISISLILYIKLYYFDNAK